VDYQRWILLRQIERWMEVPMVALGFAWLALLILDLTTGLPPILASASHVIWLLFILDFLLRLFLAPRKRLYIRRNWLTFIALLIPALRTLRALRAIRVLRAARGINLLRILTSLNRGMKALRRTMRRRGVGYVLLLTVLVVLAGAAGMYAFERNATGFSSYSEALWWTAMIITSLGSEAWPQTPEGRTLCLILALYGLAILGYVTATLASLFIGRDAEDSESGPASEASVRALHAEIALLREEIRQLKR